LDWLASQWRLRTGLSNLHVASVQGCSTEYLLHARAEDNHHHLLERNQESPVMPTQRVFRGASKRLYAFLLLLLSCNVTLS
jgi:hypothetical protein